MKILKDIPYRPASGSSGLCDLFIPDRAARKNIAVLAIHGGGWSIGTKETFESVALWLCTELKLAVCNINYRLCSEAPWPACGDDCLAAARYLLDAGKPLPGKPGSRRLIIVGGSAGGHLALMTGLRLSARDVAGIVSVSGIAKLEPDMKLNPDRYRAFFGISEPFPKEKTDSASPVKYLRQDSSPILLTHTIYDGYVPVDSATEFEDAAREHGAHIESYYYNRRNDGHCIWIKGSDPHKLHPDLEAVIAAFIKKIISNNSKR